MQRTNHHVISYFVTSFAQPTIDHTLGLLSQKMASLSDETAEAVSQNGSEEDPVEDTNIFDSDGAMHPDHPLLRRAQEALKAQLLKSKAELEEVVREKTKALKVGGCGVWGAWNRGGQGPI